MQTKTIHAYVYLKKPPTYGALWLILNNFQKNIKLHIYCFVDENKIGKIRKADGAKREARFSCEKPYAQIEYDLHIFFYVLYGEIK